MRTVFLASLRTHLRRHVAAVVAVATAVAFVVVVGVLTAGARAALIERLGAPYRNAARAPGNRRAADETGALPMKPA